MGILNGIPSYFRSLALLWDELVECDDDSDLRGAFLFRQSQNRFYHQLLCQDAEVGPFEQSKTRTEYSCAFKLKDGSWLANVLARLID